MVERGCGAIVNISSIAGIRASPLLAGYSAAKGYIERFSDSLHAEYSKKGIHVQSQHPAFVVSKLSKIRKAALDKPTPKTFVKAAIKAIGYEPTLSPFWVHQTIIYITNMIPEFLWVGQVMGMHLGIRKRAYKKLGK
jgi:17beta-estradiol 17-dehydrogenase / very-long-chain 3-oxoacyl-CoA reductase